MEIADIEARLKHSKVLHSLQAGREEASYAKPVNYSLINDQRFFCGICEKIRFDAKRVFLLACFNPKQTINR